MAKTVFVIIDKETGELAARNNWETAELAEEAIRDTPCPKNYFVQEVSGEYYQELMDLVIPEGISELMPNEKDRVVCFEFGIRKMVLKWGVNNPVVLLDYLKPGSEQPQEGILTDGEPEVNPNSMPVGLAFHSGKSVDAFVSDLLVMRVMHFGAPSVEGEEGIAKYIKQSAARSAEILRGIKDEPSNW